MCLRATGTGRTGFVNVPPNNYPFYGDSEKYVPLTQSDGGQLSGVAVAKHVYACCPVCTQWAANKGTWSRA